MSEIEHKEPLNFIEQMIENDLKSGKNSFVQTRFPP
ncbi:MAG: glutaminyl-tRNA synthetase, partial [Roseivirga sp.]